MPVRQKQKLTQKLDLENAQRRDSFQTPNYATELLIPFIPYFDSHVWEPADGKGKISFVLEKHGYEVTRTDIANDGFNFLLDVPEKNFIKGVDVIITNPPFSAKRQFYDKCMEYKKPFALLIPTDYCGWIINALMNGAEKIVPTRRIDYITPSGLSGKTGQTSNFHSMWLTWGFGLGKTETFVELTTEMKKNI